MRAAICVRVSPRAQDKVRYSPEIQESKCREWCEANGHEVVTVIRDILVSGGAVNRFDSIYAALDAQPVDLFVVSDLSRWTRDEPEMFWFVKKVLADRGVALASVDEPWVGSDMPFVGTITTATVEANSMERKRINRKTSEGVRKAVAAGKVMGLARIGWTWHPDSRTWAQDAPLVRSFYAMWSSGASAVEIARQFGMHAGSVRRAIASRVQRPIVGDEIWLQAQARPKIRRQRRDAQRGNPLRGLLHCPFCGGSMQHSPSRYLGYYCYRKQVVPRGHDWVFLSGLRYVLPVIRDTIASLRVPDEEAALIEAARAPVVTRARDFAGERDRLTMAWVRGNLTADRYDRALAELDEAERAVVPPPPIEERVEILRAFEQLDLDDRDPEACAHINAILREVLTLTVHPDRSVTAEVNPPYLAWR